MHWSVSLSDIKTAFDAACAGAAARALARQQQQAAAATAAAAAAQQAALVSSEAPAGWGLMGFSPLAAPASAAAAMQAVATFAGAAAARVFNKRKRSSTAVESCDEGGRDQQSSSTAGTLVLAAKANQQEAAAGEEQQGEQHDLREAAPLSQPRPQSVQHAAECHGGGEDDEEQQQHSRKRRRRTAPEPSADTAEAGRTAGAAAAPKACGSQAAARKPPAIQTQRLSGRTIQPLSPSAGTADAAAAAVVDGFFSQDPAAASAAASPCADASLGTGAQRLPRQFKLRSPEAHFAGYTWRLVLYFQPRQAAADGSTGAERCDVNVQQAKASRGVARQAVAAAHAVRLPEDAAASGAGTGDSNCSWTARLAVEAWPAVTLAPAGSSTVAFSGSLGVCLARGSSDAAAGQGRARGASQPGPSRRRSRSGAASPASRGDRAPGACKDPTPSPARRLNITTGGDSPARYMACPEAAAAAAAGGGGSSRQQVGRDCSPAGRELLVGPGPRGQAGLLSIPESDRDSEVPESSEQVSSSSSEEEESSSQEEEPAAVQDSDCDGEGFAIVGEFPAGAGAAARAAAASTPGRGGGRRGSQQQGKPVRRAGRRPASAAAVTPGAPDGGSNGTDADEGEWRVLQLPQVRCVL